MDFRQVSWIGGFQGNLMAEHFGGVLFVVGVGAVRSDVTMELASIIDFWR